MGVVITAEADQVVDQRIDRVVDQVAGVTIESCGGDTLTNEIFGYASALGVSLILIPQVVKTYREKNVRGLSLTFLLLNLWTSEAFLIYGVLERI